jgi:cyclophilin family peptidyl-prolyl cis-trans isomerase
MIRSSKTTARWFARVAVAAGVLVLASVAAAQTPAPKVTIETNMGSFVIELDPEHAPKTVENFLRYVREGYYDGLSFHRIVPGFVIQGGGYEPDGREHTLHDPIALETKTAAHNARGTLSMARTSDPNSGTSQFFVNLEDNPDLDPESGDPGNLTGYTVFGRVVEGMAVVDAIAMVPLGGPYGPVPRSAPQSPVVMQHVTIAR